METIEYKINLSLPVGIEKENPEFFGSIMTIWRHDMEYSHFKGHCPETLSLTVHGNRTYYPGLMLMFDYEQKAPGEWELRFWNFWPTNNR
jgi:hypothetical protein